MNAYQRTSHTVKPGALQHPLQKACEDLMRRSPELHKIHVQVHAQARAMGKKTPALVNAELVAWAKKSGIYGRLAEMVGKFKDQEAEARDGVKQLTLAPPKSSELYERIEPKADIVDVGVGDGKRLARYAGYFGSVRGVDVVKKELVPDWPKEWRVEVAAFGGSRLCVTSFLAYSQFTAEVRLNVELSDGIHVVPDHVALRKLGVVRDIEQGKIECNMGEYKFVEDDLGDVRGESLRTFYQGYNTYRQRKVTFEVQGRSDKLKPNGNRFFTRMQRDLFIDEFTPKYNGTYLELRVVDGKWVMKDNIGRGVIGKTNAPDMLLHLESVEDRFVLLRVEKFRNYRPFHSLGMLEKFCARIEIELMGKIVQAPTVIKDLRNWKEEFPDADGVVCRSGGMDYVMNCGIHLDLCGESRDDLTRFLQEQQGAKSVIHDGTVNDVQVYEVCCKIRDDGSALCVWKRRTDKTTVDGFKFWAGKFKLLTIEKYLLKFERKKEKGGMTWELNDGTD